MSEHVEGLNRDQTALFPDTLEEYVDEENPRAGLSLNWCKVVISLIFGFGGKFEVHSLSLFLCSGRPSRTCKRALSD